VTGDPLTYPTSITSYYFIPIYVEVCKIASFPCGPPIKILYTFLIFPYLLVTCSTSFFRLYKIKHFGVEA
jgi:hypothetical protein